MDAKRKRLLEQALDEATRGCNCGMGVAECDRCREVVLVEALEEAQAKLAAMVEAVEGNHIVMHHSQACSVRQMMSEVPCQCEVGKFKEALAAAKVQP